MPPVHSELPTLPISLPNAQALHLLHACHVPGHAAVLLVRSWQAWAAQAERDAPGHVCCEPSVDELRGACHQAQRDVGVHAGACMPMRTDRTRL